MADYSSSLPVKTLSDVYLQIDIARTLGSAVGATNPIWTRLSDGTSAVGTSGNPLYVSISGTTTVSGTVTANQGTAGASAWLINVGQIGGTSVGVANPMPARLSDGTNWISATNPLPVTFGYPSSPICSYHEATDVASGGSATHTYTVTSGKTFYLNRVICSASGAAKFEIKTGASGAETVKAVVFVTSAFPTTEAVFDGKHSVSGGNNVLVVKHNRENTAMSIYSTILGEEV